MTQACIGPGRVFERGDDEVVRQLALSTGIPLQCDGLGAVQVDDAEPEPGGPRAEQEVELVALRSIFGCTDSLACTGERVALEAALAEICDRLFHKLVARLLRPQVGDGIVTIRIRIVYWAEYFQAVWVDDDVRVLELSLDEDRFPHSGATYDIHELR